MKSEDDWVIMDKKILYFKGDYTIWKKYQKQEKNILQIFDVIF